MMKTFAALSIFFAVACNHEKTTSPPAPRETATSATSDNSVPRLPVGTKAKCPVTGEEFTVSANTTQIVYQGRRYAFCCDDCKPTFLKNPAKFAKSPSM